MDTKVEASMIRSINIAELAGIVKGRVVGSYDEKMRITGTCAVDRYVETKVSFIKNRKYGKMLNDLQHAVILVPEDLVELCEKNPQNVYIVVRDVLNSMMDIQDFFYKERFIFAQEGISVTAKIDKSAKIGSEVYIGENVYVGKNVVIGSRAKILHNSCLLDNVIVGSGTYIYPGVCIYAGCQIGDDCLIHSGTQISVDGFRFEQDMEQGLVRKWLHAGTVIIGNRVEIGANCTIDRATFEGDVTVLSNDVKLDDQVHIGHNAKIGARTLIAAQTCISGSVKTGQDVWIGAGVTISNGVTIGDRAKVLLNAVVASDVAEGEIVSGFYAMPHHQWKRVYTKLKEGA